MVLLYGAYGYTGKLILEQLLTTNLPVTIAGRDAEKLKLLASQYGVGYATFGLHDFEKMTHALSKADVVIHCAGPFASTALPMATACLKTKTHYLDISGEYTVFEELQELNTQAKSAGIMLLPGAGFDVVPSDCLAAKLKNILPKASHLELAFTTTGGSFSQGTAKTMIENAYKGQAFRQNSVLKFRPHGKSSKVIDFGDFKQTAVGISWGDVSTAYVSTGIPNIEVFTGTNTRQLKQLKLLNWFKIPLSWTWVQNLLKKLIDKKPPGPSIEKRQNAVSLLWGKVSDGKSERELQLKTPNGYTLTAFTTVHITEKILAGNFKPGYQTPSSAYGFNLIEEITNCSFSG